MLYRIFLILHNVRYITVQYFTQYFYRMSADICIFPESAQLSRTNIKFFYQFILADTFVFHCLPKWGISNHFLYLYLNIIHKWGIIILAIFG